MTVQLADTAPPTVTTTTAPSSPGGSVATTVPASAQSVVHLQTTAHPSRLSVGATVAANVTVVNSGTGALIASGTATVADPLDVPAAALPQNGAVTVQATNTTTSGGQMVIAGGDPYVALSQAVIDPNASTAISPTDSAGTPATSDANSAIVAQTPVGALDVSSEDNTTTVQTGDGDGFAVTPDVASNAPVPLVPGIVGMPADSATEPSSIVQASSDELKLGAVFSDATDLTASFLIGDAADPTTPTLDSPNDEIAVIGEDGTPLATLDDLTAVDAAGTAVSATATIDQNDHLAIQVTPTPSTVYPIVATITPHRLPGGGGGPSNGPGGAVSDDVARDGENLTKVKNCKTDLKTGASAQCENTLLAHYQPVLVMSPNELFYPSDVSGFTEHSAYHDRDGHVVWRNDGPSALPSGSTNRDDYLQLLGCPEKKAGPLTDCARMASAASDYSNPTTSTHRMYARFVPVSSTDKHQAIAYGQGVKYVLQYWMFYWADDYYDENLAQQHQGDWEFAQIDLNGSGAPKRIVASQHACGEQLTWGQEKLWGWQHPVLFVSRGSHSLWFAGGRKTLGRGSRCGDFGLDQTYKVSVHGVGYTLHLASAADAANKFHGWHDTTPTAATGRYLFPQGDIRPTRPRHTSLVRISGAPNTDTSWVHYQGHWGDRQYVGLNHPTICNSLGINICISLPSLFIPTGRGPEGLESSKRWHTYGNPVFWYDSRTAGCRWPIRSVLSQTGTTC